MGDLLFAIANLSRKLGIEPEAALRRANDKFTRRFDNSSRISEGGPMTLEGGRRWQTANTSHEDQREQGTKNKSSKTKTVTE